MRFNIIIFAPDIHGLREARVLGVKFWVLSLQPPSHAGLSTIQRVPGGITGGATPVPIPNTEVKPSKADDTAAVRQRESRTLPGYKKGPLVERSAGLFMCAQHGRDLGGASPAAS